MGTLRVRNTDLEAIELSNGTCQIQGKCIFTGKIYKVFVDTNGLERFNMGEAAQNCFPNLNREDREFLISGISPEGWLTTFGE